MKVGKVKVVKVKVQVVKVKVVKVKLNVNVKAKSESGCDSNTEGELIKAYKGRRQGREALNRAAALPKAGPAWP